MTTTKLRSRSYYMSDISSTRNFWAACGAIGLFISIMCLGISKERMNNRREAYSMERCHEVPGQDYEGCMIRAYKEYEDDQIRGVVGVVGVVTHGARWPSHDV